MSEAQVADNKTADAKPAADKPAESAATDTASASTKLLDSCTTKTEGSTTAAASTDAKDSAPTVKEDHVDSLLRGDQPKDGSDDDDKTSTCQKDYLDSLKQGVKPAEAQNTAKLHELALHEEQVASLPKDSKQVGGDDKSGYKVFEGPDGKRYFQKGNGQYTVLELSADGKRYEGTMDGGQKKVVIDKNDKNESVQVLDGKDKQVENFEHKQGGGNIISKGWSAFTGAVNDYVVKPIGAATEAVKNAAIDIFSDDKYDFSADTKDLVQPPAPPDDYNWLNDLSAGDDFWSKESKGGTKLGDWDSEIWNKFDPTVDPTKDNKVFTGTDGTEVVKSADGKYTLKYNGKDVALNEEKAEGRGGRPVTNYTATLEDGRKVTYSDRQGGVTVGETRIARNDSSERVNELPPGARKIDLAKEGERGARGQKFDVYEGPDGTRYFQNKDGDYTTMKVSADGKKWEGRLANGDRVVMDKDDPKVRMTIFDNEGEIKTYVNQNGDIHHRHRRGNGDVDRQEQVYSTNPPPKSEAELGQMSEGYSEFRHNGEVTKYLKQDNDNWMRIEQGADGLKELAIRRNGHDFVRDSGGRWKNADSGQTVPADVARTLEEWTQKGFGNLGARVDMRTGDMTHALYRNQEERQECQRNVACGITPVGETTSTLESTEAKDNTRNETEKVTSGDYEVVSSDTGQAIYGLDRKDLEFHTGDGTGEDDWTLGDDGFWDNSGFGMDAEGNIYDEDGHCVYDEGFSGSTEQIRQQEYERSEAVGDSEIGKAASLISPARGVIYGAFDPATAESLCSAAYSGLSGAINLAMSCGNTAMAGELMSKQAEASSWIFIASGARKATTQHSYELPGGGSGMGFMMAEAARSTASGVSPTTAFENMLAKVDPTNPKVAHRTGQANPVNLTWTDSQKDNSTRAA